MKKIRSILSLALASVLLGTLLASCSASSSSQASSKPAEASGGQSTVTGAAEPGWKKNAEDKVELTWYMNFSWLLLPEWKQDLVSQKIEEETGIKIKFIIPAGNEAEKMNTMLASGDLPDIMTMWWGEGFIGDMIDADMLQPLNKLADEYDPYFYEVANKEKMAWYQNPDGNVYGYPNASVAPSQYKEVKTLESTQSMLVRKDIYEAIGSPDMSTVEGFTKALEDAQAKYPMVDGAPLIPVGFTEFTELGNAALDAQLQNFLAVPFEKDGKFYDRQTDPDYVSWLKAFRNMNEKGLISKDVFIDKTTQIGEKMTQGRYFALIFPWSDCQFPNITRYAQDPNSVYIAVDGPKNMNGDAHTLEGPSIAGWCLNMITKDCERADRAIELFSYLMSEEGQLLTYCGIEGATYDVVDGKNVIKSEVLALRDTDPAEASKKYGILNTYWMFMDPGMYTQWEVPAPPVVQAAKEWTYPYVTDFSLYIVPAFISNSEEAIAQTKIDMLWGKTLPKLILAASEQEFDTVFADYLQQKDAAGFAKIAAYKQAAYDANREKLS